MKDIEKLDKDYVLHTYARNYVNFKKRCKCNTL